MLITLLSLLYTPLMGYSQLVVTGVYFLTGLLISIIAAIMMKRCATKCESQTSTVQSPQEPIDQSVTETLAMLQKNGRLVDFIKEDISGYSDNQVGAAVRSIHKGCKETLDEYVVIESVIDKIEGSEVTIDGDGYSPNSIRLTGNVPSNPPYKGILQHCGWRVTKTQFPKRAQAGQNIVHPAEIEIS